MIEAALCLLLLGQPGAEEKTAPSPKAWTQFYADAARDYTVTLGDKQTPAKFQERPVFNWASINNYHGAVFTWTDKGRPVVVGTIFSMPQADSQRQAVHEFAAFGDDAPTVTPSAGNGWTPKSTAKLQPLANAPSPPKQANLLALQCRKLAKTFTAEMNRKGERWDLRLLPTPLVEYPAPRTGILGGGLFAFVGYSTDPEILLLLEARDTADGPAWHYQAVRFSDKTLTLKYQNKPLWESLREAHGGAGPDTDDPQYHVLHSQRLDVELVEKLSAGE